MKPFLVLLLGILTTTCLTAQPREGKHVELSLSGGFQSYSVDDNDATSAFLLTPRIGVFLIQGLELEPEFTLMTVSSGDPMYMVNANVSYNFRTSGKSVPFLLVGYGFSNTFPIFNLPVTRTDFTIGVANAGAGVKIFIADDVAVRLEYRFQYFSGEGDRQFFGSFSYQNKLEVRMHTVQVGLAVLL